MTRVSAIVVTQHGGPLLDACLRTLRTALAPLDAELLVVDNSTAGIAAAGARVLAQGRNPASRAASRPGSRRRRASGSCSSTTTRSSSRARSWRCWAPPTAPPRSARPAARSASMRAATRSTPPAWSSTGWASPTTASRARARDDGGPVEEVFGASACVALYRRAMLDAIGGFDASFFAFGEDADVAWRARTAGWSCLYVPASVAYHHGSATAGEASPRKYFLVGRNRMRLLAKNATGGQLARWGWAMALYDLAYVLFVARDRPHPRPAARPPGGAARVARATGARAPHARPGPARRADRPARRLAPAQGLPLECLTGAAFDAGHDRVGRPLPCEAGGACPRALPRRAVSAGSASAARNASATSAGATRAHNGPLPSASSAASYPAATGSRPCGSGKPASGSRKSAGPPKRGAMGATPHAIASSNLTPKPSPRNGASRRSNAARNAPSRSGG